MACLLRPVPVPLTEDASRLHDQSADRASRRSDLVLVDGWKLSIWVYE
jgi:hypothetical protein